MALRAINGDTSCFGTGDPDVLAREVMVEPRINALLVSFDGTTLVQVHSGKHKIDKTTRYGSTSQLDALVLETGVSRMTVKASNEDFVRVETEEETYE